MDAMIPNYNFDLSKAIKAIEPVNMRDYSMADWKYEKIKESAFNEILFESILSILSLVISFIITFIGIERIIEMVLLIMSGLLYILVLSTILNTFIVLKRLKFLFDERN